MDRKKRILVTVGECKAEAELLTNLSPQAAAAFWESLPIEATLTPGKWSGRAGFFYTDDQRLRDIEELEYPVASIYPGYFVMRPRGTEILVSYGVSEYRWATGTDYVTPLAQVVEGYADFVSTLSRMHDEGETSITLRRAE